MEYVAELFYRRSPDRAEADEADSYLEFFQAVRPSWGPVVTLYREVTDVIAVRLSFDAESYVDAAGRLDAMGLPEWLIPEGIRVVPESLMAAIA